MKLESQRAMFPSICLETPYSPQKRKTLVMFHMFFYFTNSHTMVTSQPSDQSKHSVNVKMSQWWVQSRIMWYLTF